MSSGYSDLLRSLNRCGAHYLVVGGYAVMRYTEPRYTRDLDLWVDPAPANSELVYRALAEFGAPLAGITPMDFTKGDMVYQLGVDPVRADILMDIPGLAFGEAWQRRVQTDFLGEPASMISRDDLIASKRASRRRQDRVDLRRLLRRRE
jgi:hypothetical protein